MFKLPDGSGFTTGSLPLPKDHWIYEPTGDPPVQFKMIDGQSREILEKIIKNAARYAIKAATMSGKEMDFDPDALIQNLQVGLFGPYGKCSR